MSTQNMTTVGTPAPENRPRVKPNPKAPRQALPLLSPDDRLRGPEEVALGFSLAQVQVEALRCLQCKNPTCVDACPLHINVKGFIGLMAQGDFAGAFDKISEESPFPGICGRVCQHELFCERACLLGKKLEPVAIGSLERFAADYHRRTASSSASSAGARVGPRVALVGSGPASLIAAYDLVRNGYRVTIFEALHGLGGVLAYGIPNFRLPREIIRDEVNRLRSMGVEFRTDFIVGKTEAVDELFAEGFQAIFLGTGAGLPHLMNIPGENLIGVYTANEYLTRLNLMEAFRFPESDTPVRIGKRVVVVGGGNSAMDAARWSRRMGSETTIMFRRGRAELRARLEEIEHAEEEGVHFDFLAAPVRLFGDEKGILHEMECIRMQLGEVDESGRPSPVPMPGSEFRMEVDTVVMAIGQSPNPTVQRATPQLLTKRGKVVIDASGMTSMPNVFAGGDVVRGGSTVILAMRDGRAAAAAIQTPSSSRRLWHRRLAPAASRSGSATAHQAAECLCRPACRQSDFGEAAGLPRRSPGCRWKPRKLPGGGSPGQFVIIRPTETSERIPLTIVDGDAAAGSMTLVVQALGKTSSDHSAAGSRRSLGGPSGAARVSRPASRTSATSCAWPGGVGVAELLPVARAFREAGNHVTALCGARSSSLIILDEELRAAADEVYWATDDGTAGCTARSWI